MQQHKNCLNCENDLYQFGVESNFNELGDRYPDSMVHGAILGPIWGRQDPGGPHVGPMNLAIWEWTHF